MGECCHPDPRWVAEVLHTKIPSMAFLRICLQELRAKALGMHEPGVGMGGAPMPKCASELIPPPVLPRQRGKRPIPMDVLRHPQTGNGLDDMGRCG